MSPCQYLIGSATFSRNRTCGLQPIEFHIIRKKQEFPDVIKNIFPETPLQNCDVSGYQSIERRSLTYGQYRTLHEIKRMLTIAVHQLLYTETDAAECVFSEKATLCKVGKGIPVEEPL
jgi:hypothetical protein